MTAVAHLSYTSILQCFVSVPVCVVFLLHKLVHPWFIPELVAKKHFRTPSLIVVLCGKRESNQKGFYKSWDQATLPKEPIYFTDQRARSRVHFRDSEGCGQKTPWGPQSHPNMAKFCITTVKSELIAEFNKTFLKIILWKTGFTNKTDTSLWFTM